MILSHRAPSCLNMSSYRAIWNHFSSNSMIVDQINIPKLIDLNFQISGKLVLIHREGMFSKVVRLENMRLNGIDEIFWGRTFRNTSYFNLRSSESGSLVPGPFEHFCREMGTFGPRKNTDGRTRGKSTHLGLEAIVATGLSLGQDQE